MMLTAYFSYGEVESIKNLKSLMFCNFVFPPFVVLPTP